jgi:hypothetical protein
MLVVMTLGSQLSVGSLLLTMQESPKILMQAFSLLLKITPEVPVSALMK